MKKSIKDDKGQLSSLLLTLRSEVVKIEEKMITQFQQYCNNFVVGPELMSVLKWILTPLTYYISHLWVGGQFSV